MRRLHDLLTPAQLDTIQNAPQFRGTRHPTWYPLYHEQQHLIDPLYSGKPRAIDALVHNAVRCINQQCNGPDWLRDLIVPLMDQVDSNNASSALAEIRAYGGLIEAGFAVTPILRRDEATPDFRIDAGDGEITVEVFAKHQDKQQDALLDAVHSATDPLPEGAERRVYLSGHAEVISTVVTLTPAGRPDPTKAQDSVQANMISRVCAIKQNEKQILADRPALMIMDFAQFGGPIAATFLTAGQTAPIETGHQGITCGAFWYALYGWKQAPIFEEGSHRLVRMEHDGRFRLQGMAKSKVSAVLVVLADSTVLLENPWAIHRLPPQARFALCRFPWFDLTKSLADWHPGDLEQQIAIHRRMIEAMDQPDE